MALLPKFLDWHVFLGIFLHHLQSKREKQLSQDLLQRSATVISSNLQIQQYLNYFWWVGWLGSWMEKCLVLDHGVWIKHRKVHVPWLRAKYSFRPTQNNLVKQCFIISRFSFLILLEINKKTLTSTQWMLNCVCTKWTEDACRARWRFLDPAIHILAVA